MTNVAPGHVDGRIEGRADTIELYYKLPQQLQVPSVAPNTDLRLILRDEIFGMEYRRQVYLSSPEQRTLLFYLSDGGQQPYQRSLTAPPIRITQEVPGADSISRVSISYAGGQPLLLKPGDRAPAGPPGRRVEIFLVATFFTPKGGRPPMEGDPYHVTLMVYAIQ